MGFYNMNTGGAPFFKQMADNYAISDDYLQFVMGGTGANFIGLVTGDAAFYNLDGQPATPPNNFTYTYGNPPVSVQTSQIENPQSAIRPFQPKLVYGGRLPRQFLRQMLG